MCDKDKVGKDHSVEDNKKVDTGEAAGGCGVTSEFIHYGSPEAEKVWEKEEAEPKNDEELDVVGTVEALDNLIEAVKNELVQK